MYDKGERGVVRTMSEAFRWYRMAAEKGEALAQVKLGVMFAKGRGVSAG